MLADGQGAKVGAASMHPAALRGAEGSGHKGHELGAKGPLNPLAQVIPDHDVAVGSSALRGALPLPNFLEDAALVLERLPPSGRNLEDQRVQRNGGRRGGSAQRSLRDRVLAVRAPAAGPSH